MNRINKIKGMDVNELAETLVHISNDYNFFVSPSGKSFYCGNENSHRDCLNDAVSWLLEDLADTDCGVRNQPISRVDRIKAFAQNKEEEKIAKEKAEQEEIVALKSKILSFKSRIKELLEVGNACRKNGIALTGSAFGCREGYDTHQFITNGWSHLLGFVKNKDGYFTMVGIMGGGACDYNLTTDGNVIEVSGGVLPILRRFVREFDEFEREFYAYVDKTVGVKK